MATTNVTMRIDTSVKTQLQVSISADARLFPFRLKGVSLTADGSE